MPNHIQNRLRIVGDESRVKEIFALIAGDEKSRIDFDKIISTPDVIKAVGQINSNVETAVKVAVDAPVSEHALIAALETANRKNVTLDETERPAFENALKAYKETGYVYWYDWNIAHWGTKWNAYQTPDARDTEDTIFFQTAWSCPVPIIERLAKIFTDVEIYLDYADEDTGANTGRIICRDGRAYISRPENQSNEAYELAFELNPDRKQNYQLIDGKYEYVESDD
jgi:hypothetical protein